MEQFLAFINYPLFTGASHTYTVGQVVLVLVTILLGFYFVRRVEMLLMAKMTVMQRDKDLILLVRRLYLVVAYVLLALLILSVLGIPLAAFAFVSGAVAIGVGFGAQNIINNFISGWILMWERPIRIGDSIELGDVKGSVETINTRSTLIRRADGVHILVPNSHLLENRLVNSTLIDRLLRGEVRVGVAYGSPIKKVQELIYQAASEHSEIIRMPAPLVVFADFGENSLNFELYFWINGDMDMRVIRSDLRFRIAELFDANGIFIAAPRQEVYLEGALKLLKD
ncbi:MAG: mechanosensitive ion channel family protein [Gammaproteobacteria bacterium]